VNDRATGRNINRSPIPVEGGEERGGKGLPYTMYTTADISDWCAYWKFWKETPKPYPFCGCGPNAFSPFKRGTSSDK